MLYEVITHGREATPFEPARVVGGRDQPRGNGSVEHAVIGPMQLGGLAAPAVHLLALLGMRGKPGLDLGASYNFV